MTVRTTPNTKLSVETLVDILTPREIVLSPNADQVAYEAGPDARAGENEVSSIWVAQVQKAASARQITSGLYSDRSPGWSPDGESITFVSDRAKAGASSAIYRIPVDKGGEAVPLTPTENQSDIYEYRWSPDGNFIAFASSDEKSPENKRKEELKDDVNIYNTEWPYGRLRLLHVSTGTISVLYAKDAHVGYFTWSPDSKHIVVITLDTPTANSADADGMGFDKVSLLGGQIEHICHFPGGVTSTLEWIDNAEGKSGIYFLAPQVTESTLSIFGLYTLDISQRKWSLDSDYGRKDLGMLGSSKKELALVQQLATKDRILIKDSKLPPVTSSQSIDEIDIGRNEHNEMVFAFIKSSPSKPFEVFTQVAPKDERDKDELFADDAVRVSDHGSVISHFEVAKPEWLHCESEDGKFTLDGLYLRPLSTNTHSGKPLPTVVWIHGGPLGREIESFNYADVFLGPLLLAKGKYGILLPNYRGSAGKGNDFAMHSRNGAGTLDYDDILSMVDEGIKRGYIDKERVIVAGWSQGGLLSYLCAVRNGRTYAGKEKDWKFKAVIAGGGVVDWDMMCMSSDLPYFESEMTGGAPWERESKDDVGSRKGSAIWEMAKAAKEKRIPPILILHGENDQRVPVTQAIAFHRGCLKYKLPCELAIYPREPHVFDERMHIIDAANRAIRFCDLHLCQ